MTKEHLKILERALRINRVLYSMKIPVELFVKNYRSSNNEISIVLHDYKTENSDYTIDINMSDDEIIKSAVKLCEPKFIKPKRLCVNMIGMEVYIDKETPVIVESIHKDYVMCNGAEYNYEAIWIKE